MKTSYRLLILAGPSGGHLFPAFAFAEAFRKRFPSSRLELATGEKGRGIAQNFDARVFNAIHYLQDFPSVSGISLRVFPFLLKLLLSFFHFSGILSKSQPDLCVGFGSYVAFPGVVLSAWEKIPTLIHEQNVIPGKATQSLRKVADCVAVSFEETFSRAKLKQRIVTGLPLREALIAAACQKSHAKEHSVFRILIVGGSQGAQQLNRVVLKSFSELSPEEKEKIAVIHITGKTDWKWVTDFYRQLDIHHQTFPFFEYMEKLYTQTDFAITRAGANTLFELALFRIPAVVIPYPFAGSHQKANAEFFAARGAVICKDESTVDEKWLLGEIRLFQKDLNQRRKMAEALAGLQTPQAAEELVEAAGRLLEGKA